MSDRFAGAGAHAVEKTATPSPRIPIQPLAYRVRDAAAMVGLGRTSIYALISAGNLQPVRIAGRVVIPRAQLEALIEARGQ